MESRLTVPLFMQKILHAPERKSMMPEKDAIAELRRCSGTQFDPHVVEVFTKMLEREDLPQQEMEALAASYTEADTDERTGV